MLDKHNVNVIEMRETVEARIASLQLQLANIEMPFDKTQVVRGRLAEARRMLQTLNGESSHGRTEE